jgi:hypothetical protein
MGTPLYPKDMGTEWMNLKQQLKGAFTSANSRVPYQKIAAGVLKVASSFEMLAGSFMQFNWASGQLGMILGRHFTGGDPAEGIFLRRSDGKLALWIFNRTTDNFGFTALYDQDVTPNGIFTDDGVAKKGIGRPWLSHMFVNTTELTAPPGGRITGGTTDVTVVTSFPNIQHPYIHYVAYVYTAVGGATVEYKFKDPGLGTTLHTGTATAGYVSGDFAINTDHPFGEDKNLDLTIRRASGSGNVGITLIQLSGRQSP